MHCETEELGRKRGFISLILSFPKISLIPFLTDSPFLAVLLMLGVIVRTVQEYYCSCGHD